MMRNSTRRCSPVRLHLHQLERRDTPAGTVNATFSGGVLTLTGDDDSNQIQLMQLGTDTTVVGNGGTTITGGPTFSNVTSIKAVMKGGNDEILTNPVGPFSLTGGANFDLGDGNNSLGLSTAGVITLGSLTVKAGDGDDSITVSGLATSKVNGNASFDMKAGDTSLQMNNVEVAGSGGFKFNATDGADSVHFVAVAVTKAATISTGLGQLEFVTTGGTLGSVSLTGTGVNPTLPFDGVELVLQGTAVTGAVKVTSQTGARVDMTGVTAANLSVTAGRLGAVLVSASGAVNLTAGGVTVKGGSSQLSVSPGVLLDATGDIALLATDSNFLALSGGTLNAANVRLTSSQSAAANGQAIIFATGGAAIALDRDITISSRIAQLAVQDSTVNARNATVGGSFASQVSVNGGASPLLSLTGSLSLKGTHASVDQSVGEIKVGGNLSVSGTATGGVSSDPGTVLDVTGTLSIAAGSGDVSFVFEGNQLSVGRDLTVQGQQSQTLNVDPFTTSTVGRNVTFTLGNDDDVLSINSKVAVTGNLTINAGAGNNSITVGTNGANFSVGGNLAISSLGGDDSVTLNSPQVTGTTRITTGAGADLLDIRGPSTFTGTTTIDLGAGDDTWNVANDPGTTSGMVTFTGAVNAKLGAGNDTLRLGLSVASGGNLNTRVNFADLTANKIDGGAGLNFFDDEAAQVTGTVVIVNFTDPTP